MYILNNGVSSFRLFAGMQLLEPNVATVDIILDIGTVLSINAGTINRFSSYL